jgi:hypothetical protein
MAVLEQPWPRGGPIVAGSVVFGLRATSVPEANGTSTALLVVHGWTRGWATTALRPPARGPYGGTNR